MTTATSLYGQSLYDLAIISRFSLNPRSPEENVWVFSKKRSGISCIRICRIS